MPVVVPAWLAVPASIKLGVEDTDLVPPCDGVTVGLPVDVTDLVAPWDGVPLPVDVEVAAARVGVSVWVWVWLEVAPDEAAEVTV